MLDQQDRLVPRNDSAFVRLRNRKLYYFLLSSILNHFVNRVIDRVRSEHWPLHWPVQQICQVEIALAEVDGLSTDK